MVTIDYKVTCDGGSHKINFSEDSFDSAMKEAAKKVAEEFKAGRAQRLIISRRTIEHGQVLSVTPVGVCESMVYNGGR